MTTHDPKLMAELAGVLAGGPEIRLAVLFGSAATGRSHAASDVDIGLIFAREESLATELDLQLALERVVGKSVDLVRLDEASTLVQWQVAVHGLPICAAPHEWSRFRARAASEYADFRPAFEAAAALFQRRLLEGRR